MRALFTILLNYANLLSFVDQAFLMHCVTDWSVACMVKNIEKAAVRKRSYNGKSIVYCSVGGDSRQGCFGTTKKEYGE